MEFQGVIAMLLISTTQALDADVLILGAGTAGFTAAEKLSEQNISFLIIEGADQIGGRIRSKQFGGIWVDLGTMGLYGTNASNQALIDKYNITGKNADFESVVVKTSNGSQPDAQAEAAWEKLGEAKKIIDELYNKIKDGKKRDMSSRTALEYGMWFPQNPVDDVIEIYDYDYEFARIPDAISTYSLQSVKSYLSVPYISTNKKGLQDVITKYSQTILKDNDDRLKLNEVVSNISCTDTMVSVSVNSGKTYTGKYAIVTFSMGVLKSGSVKFEPALPAWKLDSIYRTSMDVYTQIYVKFASGVSKFWGDEEYVLHANPRRGYYPIIFNMEAEGFFPNGTNMLTFIVMGEEARRVERSEKSEIKAEITDVLKKMYGASTPEPEDILITKWLDDPLSKGSFSSRNVGDNSAQFMRALTSPVCRIYFAGEAYDDVLDGFVEGAKQSARNTVTKLVDCYKNKKCPKYSSDPVPVQQPPSTCGAFQMHVSLVAFFTVLMVELI